MSNNEPNQYLKDIEDYGRKQYVPGAYTGSEMPPFVKHHRNKSLKILAVLVMFFISLFIVSSLIFKF